MTYHPWWPVNVYISISSHGIVNHLSSFILYYLYYCQIWIFVVSLCSILVSKWTFFISAFYKPSKKWELQWILKLWISIVSLFYEENTMTNNNWNCKFFKRNVNKQAMIMFEHQCSVNYFLIEERKMFLSLSYLGERIKDFRTGIDLETNIFKIFR